VPPVDQRAGGMGLPPTADRRVGPQDPRLTGMSTQREKLMRVSCWSISNLAACSFQSVHQLL
jgi:hypothetical protein